MYDIICSLEACLESSSTDDNARLNLTGYNLVRTDKLSNIKRSGVVLFERILHWSIGTSQ